MTNPTRLPRFALALLTAFAIASCESLTESPQRQPLSATLSGDSVKPTPVTTDGAGAFSGTIRALDAKATFEYSLTFSGLAGNATAVHLHGPSSAANSADILVNLASLPGGSTGEASLGATTGSAQGTLDLSSAITPTVSGDSLHVLLDAGLVYVDVHTSSHAAGEIRGQLRKR